MNEERESLIRSLIDLFKRDLESLNSSAASAHSAATHEESQAEDRHDTFAIEASYLAHGQSIRALELARTVEEFEGHLLRAPNPGICGPGLRVKLILDGVPMDAFLSVHGGGTRVKVGSAIIQVVSITSPLGEALLGLKEGDASSVELQGREKEIAVLKIR